MFDELLAQPGVREVHELRSEFGFLAFHGGSLERQTAEIAMEAADRSGSSVYAVLQPDDLWWHVPSIQVDPSLAPRLEEFLTHVRHVVSIHGYGRPGYWTTLLVGGRNRRLARRLGGSLRQHLTGYDVVDDLDAIPPDLRGVHPRNPANLPRDEGVQLELPMRVRGLGPHWVDWPPGEPVPHRAALVDALVEAALSAGTAGPVRDN